MKKILSSLFLIGFFVWIANGQTQSNEIETGNQQNSTVEIEKFDPTRNAVSDLQQAIARAQAEEKRIILDVGGEWCGWCRALDKFFSQNPNILKLRDEKFIWVKVNYSDENNNEEFLAKYPSVAGYPHLFVLEKDGTLLQSQKTEELEGGSSYSQKKFLAFLKKWSPGQNTESEVVTQK